MRENGRKKVPMGTKLAWILIPAFLYGSLILLIENWRIRRERKKRGLK